MVNDVGFLSPLQNALDCAETVQPTSRAAMVSRHLIFSVLFMIIVILLLFYCYFFAAGCEAVFLRMFIAMLTIRHKGVRFVAFFNSIYDFFSFEFVPCFCVKE